MKTMFSLLLLTAIATPAAAAERLLNFSDPAIFFPSALGKQIDVRFSEAFAATHLDKRDFNGVVLSELPEGKVCLFGREQGLDPEMPKLADVARDGGIDICVNPADVSVRAVEPPADGSPATPFYSTVKGECSWAWKTGKDIGLWTEDCKFESGHWSVAYDAAQDHYALSVDGGEPFPVLRQFHLAAGQGQDALLADLKAKGLVLNDAECQFAPSTDYKVPGGWQVWQVVPVGARKKAFESQPSDEVPEPPCGDLGYAVDYVGFFMAHKDHPDRVFYVNLGQDGTMIDPFSMSLF